MKTETNGINVNYIPLMNLVQHAKDDGAEVRTSCNVETLVFDGERVVGVKASQDDGEKFIHATRGVILCAGGMEVNRAMMSKYSATCLPGIASVATPPNGTGECIRMGQGVGADLAGYDSTGAFDGGVWWRDYGEYDLELESHINKDGNQVVRQPWLRINKLGERVPPTFRRRGAATRTPPRPTPLRPLCATQPASRWRSRAARRSSSSTRSSSS